MNSINKNIEKYRKLKNLTQKELADIMFVSPQTISKWENGTNEPSVDSIKQLAEALGITVAVLYGENDVSNKSNIDISTKDNVEFVIERTKQHPKRKIVHIIVSAIFFVVMLILGVWVIQVNLQPLHYVMFTFMCVFLVMLIGNIYLNIQFNKAENLPAVVNSKGIKLNDKELIEYSNIATVKYYKAYEKFFFKFIGSSVSAYTFGRLSIIKKDNKSINLWYVENVEAVATNINNLIANNN